MEYCLCCLAEASHWQTLAIVLPILTVVLILLLVIVEETLRRRYAANKALLTEIGKHSLSFICSELLVLIYDIRETTF